MNQLQTTVLCIITQDIYYSTDYRKGTPALASLCNSDTLCQNPNYLDHFAEKLPDCVGNQTNCREPTRLKTKQNDDQSLGGLYWPKP